MKHISLKLQWEKFSMSISLLFIFFLSLLKAKRQDHRNYLPNLIRGKLIEYTFSFLSFSSFNWFFFFLFLTFGYEGKCTGNLLTALFTLALVREKIWVFDHLVWMFSNKINIFVCKKKKKKERKWNLYVLAGEGRKYYI